MQQHFQLVVVTSGVTRIYPEWDAVVVFVPRSSRARVSDRAIPRLLIEPRTGVYQDNEIHNEFGFVLHRNRDSPIGELVGKSSNNSLLSLGSSIAQLLI